MPVIRISDYVFQLIKNFAIPLEDTPDSALKRILEDYSRIKSETSGYQSNNKEVARSEPIIIEESIAKYDRWISDSLVSLGGKAKGNEVIAHIKEAYKHEFSSTDRETLPSGEMRWVKNVNWARYDMAKKGVLVKDSPNSVLELTEKSKNLHGNFIKNPIMQGDSKMLQLTRREYGKLCRRSVEKHLFETWGKLTVERSWFKSQLNNNKILTLYSDLNNDKWFYGVMEEYWNHWDTNCYLAIIMRDGINCSYILLNTEEANNLFSRINPARDNQKKFNVRIPSVGKTYIIQWSDFPVESRIVNVENIFPEDAIIEKLTKKTGLSVEFLKKFLAKESSD